MGSGHPRPILRDMTAARHRPALLAFAAGLRLPRPTLASAGYLAAGWAIVYALGVRLYQGLGGTVGIAGTYADPEAMRRASLLAGALIFAVGVGALAFVRPWGQIGRAHV